MTRTAETEKAYLREGRRHLQRARATLATCDDPVEGFCGWLEAEEGILRPATVRLYWQEVASALRWLGQDHDRDKVDDAIKRADAALRRRSGIPDRPRTASKKVVDATASEARAVFGHLMQLAPGKSNLELIPLVALYVFLVPRYGCRPIEWLQARLEGDTLIVPNAKATNGRAGAVERHIGLASAKPIVRQAISLFLDAIPLSVQCYQSFAHWRNAAAEQLARACKSVNIRRLSLYSFRHTAIATWTRAGLLPWAVAALAGHAAPDTARRHYAGAGVGWVLPDGIPEPDPNRVRVLEQAARSPHPGAAPAAEHRDEDPFAFPTPRPRVMASDPEGTTRWQAYNARIAELRRKSSAPRLAHETSEARTDPSEVPGRRR